MFRPNPDPRPYRVEIAPTAWNSVGSMTSVDFRELRLRLDEIAEMAAIDPLSAVKGVIDLGETRGFYEVDTKTRTVTLTRLELSPW